MTDKILESNSTQTSSNSINKHKTPTASKQRTVMPVEVYTLKRLSQILSVETHPDVRKAVLDSIAMRLGEDYTPDKMSTAWQEVEKNLINMLSQLNEDERRIFANYLARSYWYQREQLTVDVNDTEESIDIHDIVATNPFTHQRIDLSIWVEGKRPLTSIESLIYRWLCDSKSPDLQRLAVRISTRFSQTLDYDEHVKIKELRERAEDQEEAEIDEEPTDDSRMGRIRAKLSDIYMAIIARVGTLVSFAPGLGQSVGNLLTEMLSMRNADEEITRFTLQKWEDTGEPQLSKLAKSLRRGLQIAKWIPIIAGGIFALLAITILLPFIILGIVLYVGFTMFFGSNDD